MSTAALATSVACLGIGFASGNLLAQSIRLWCYREWLTSATYFLTFALLILAIYLLLSNTPPEGLCT